MSNTTDATILTEDTHATPPAVTPPAVTPQTDFDIHEPKRISDLELDIRVPSVVPEIGRGVMKGLRSTGRFLAGIHAAKGAKVASTAVHVTKRSVGEVVAGVAGTGRALLGTAIGLVGGGLASLDVRVASVERARLSTAHPAEFTAIATITEIVEGETGDAVVVQTPDGTTKSLPVNGASEERVRFPGAREARTGIVWLNKAKTAFIIADAQTRTVYKVQLG